MKSRELKDGEGLEIGDYVRTKDSMGDIRYYKVYRLTKTMACCKINEHEDLRMPRKYSDFSWKPKGSSIWNNTQYKALRKVE